MEKEIDTIKSRLATIKSSYKSYLSSKESKQRNKQKRAKDMSFYVNHILSVLQEDCIYDIINDGTSMCIQFEDFYKYIDRELPKYIGQISQYLEDLEKNNLETSSDD